MENGFTDESTPLSVLQTFLTPIIITKICEETNRYVEQIRQLKPLAFQNWKLLTPEEFWIFLSVKIMMGIIKKSSIKDYWSTDKKLETPFFSKTMSRNR